MCGIFAYLGIRFTEEELKSFAEKIKHRGPDNSVYKYITPQLFYGFHRLAINGLNEESNQPMSLDGYHMICNGEIFNYKDLIAKYELEHEYKSGSDCEIILHLIKKIGLDECCKELDGEYAFVVYDEKTHNLMIARDQLGIRSLYWTINEDDMGNKQIGVCSEMKGLVGMGLEVNQFPVNSCWDLMSNKYREIYDLYVPFTEDDEETIIRKVREKLENAVKKRMMSERNIACLLSGGLDSSLIVGILNKEMKKNNSNAKLNVYSIGMEGSVDVRYAKMCAEDLNINHHIYTPTEIEFLGALEDTIYKIESYDVTSVRASTANQLICKYIRENSDNVVVYLGDVSDEIWASYRSYGLCKDEKIFYEENVKMLKNIQYFDVLRSDKSISTHGLEARVPFGDVDLVKYVMSIPPKHKMFNKEKIEKYLLRKAFDGDEHRVICKEVLWRVKEAMSDGVSHKDKSWFEMIQEYVDKIYTNEEYEEKRLKYKFNMPYDKESLFYREIFEKHYPNQGQSIPMYWRHVFSKNIDPSARLLENY